MIQERLLGLRKAHHINQQEFADLLGITVQTYRLKELGQLEFKASEMFTIARYFNKKIDDIFLDIIHQNGVK